MQINFHSIEKWLIQKFHLFVVYFAFVWLRHCNHIYLPENSYFFRHIFTAAFIFAIETMSEKNDKKVWPKSIENDDNLHLAKSHFYSICQCRHVRKHCTDKTKKPNDNEFIKQNRQRQQKNDCAKSDGKSENGESNSNAKYVLFSSPVFHFILFSLVIQIK